jgi:predicted permease
LLAYPKRIRQEHGDDMWLTFERHLRDARRAGRGAVFNLWRREIIGLWRGGRRARVTARKRQHAHRRSVGHVRSENTVGAGASWLDFKLGLRMLIKYPGLTVVGGLGIAVAVAIGAALFATSAAIYATLPLDEGDRVVAIENWDRDWNNQERRILHDFVSWRDELESVDDLGAYQDLERNLIVEGTSGKPVTVAAITASAFHLARVPAFMGRTLVEEDERRGGPPVIVIGYELWQNRFTGDPEIVGRNIRLGREVHTVVGVMPAGFGFPISHSLWVPFQLDPLDYERRDGPGIRVFGRLAAGATIEQAGAELAALGLRAATDFPDTHARLAPRIMSYPMQMYDDMEGWEFPLLYLLVVLLLVVVCVNVAVLVYARTATRRREITVRSALGASRRRIVTQLFIEALVLSSVAAGVGLAIAALAFRQAGSVMSMLSNNFIPFWIDFGVSAGTVVYVAALAVFGAVVVGVVPALQFTGRRVQSGLQHAVAGGSAMRFGGMWTAMIVLQVAFAVAVLPAAVSVGRMTVAYGFADPGFAADQFLTARLLMDYEVPRSAETDAYWNAFYSRHRELQAELVRRLDDEPGVTDVIVTLGPPGMEPIVRIEVENAADAQLRVGVGRVDIDFFDAFDVPVLSGRRFHPADVGATTVIINESLAQWVGDGNVLGRRIRFVNRGLTTNPDEVKAPWYEIVGIVSDFSSQMEPDRTVAKVYQAMAPGDVYPSTLTMRIESGAPLTFSPRLAEITTTIDPALRLDDVLTLEQVMREEQGGWRIGGWALALLTVSVLLLSAAGLYALMSFTVTQRRREIGIRVALGAEPHSLLASIFSRALRQLTLGVVVGIGVASLLDWGTAGEFTGGEGAVLLAGVAAFMLAVGLLAAVGPARRGLRIHPTEALQDGG